MGHFFIYPDELDNLRRAKVSLDTQIRVIALIIDRLDNEVLVRNKVKSVIPLRMNQGGNQTYPCLGVEFSSDREELNLDRIEDYIEMEVPKILRYTSMTEFIDFQNENIEVILNYIKLYGAQ